MPRIHVLFVVCCLTFFPTAAVSTLEAREAESRVFKAGAGSVDITPSLRDRPTVGNGYTVPADNVRDPLYARSLVLYDGKEYIVLLVIDVCGVTRPLTDRIKAIINEKTGVPVNRIMVSATHTHSAPRLGERGRKGEQHFTPENAASAAIQAYENLAPAKIGWAVGNDPKNVFSRRFQMKEGTTRVNPGMGIKDRVVTNPSLKSPDLVAPVGPVDSLIPMISVVSPDGKPIAVFASWSCHHASRGLGKNDLSGDRFGVFSEEMKRLIGKKVGKDKMSDKFVAIMSHGTGGDANCMDRLNPARKYDYKSVGRDNAEAAMAVWPNIEYHDWVPLRMTERILQLKSYKPTPENVQAAKDALTDENFTKSRTQGNSIKSIANAEKWQDTADLPLQAMRIGDFGITTLPGEIFGITGIRLKAKSPFQPTMNIAQANTGWSYIAPPEQFAMGGYEVWRNASRRTGIDAEPKIIETLIEMLNELK